MLSVTDHQKLEELLAALHACPECAGQEQKTKKCLLDFLRTNTTLELIPCGDGFYGAHREPGSPEKGIALRADYDALPLPGGGAAHLCGHDGHAAALCGVGLCLEGKTLGRDVFLLFQPAEETGAGALPCLALFQREQVGKIYGAHNLPGFPLGQVFTRFGAFACGSCGLTLRFLGRAAHAAYPEHGISPAQAVGALLCGLPELENPDAKTRCTVAGGSMGEKAFGKAADRAELWLTLRAERERALHGLRRSVLSMAQSLAESQGLRLETEEQDVFPATENDEECVKHVLSACGGQELATPMRWSEDFGHYLQHCPGAFFGIGAGETHPPLHTLEYRYPPRLLEPTMRAFCQLLCSR